MSTVLVTGWVHVYAHYCDGWLGHFSPWSRPVIQTFSNLDPIKIKANTIPSFEVFRGEREQYESNC